MNDYVKTACPIVTLQFGVYVCSHEFEANGKKTPVPSFERIQHSIKDKGREKRYLKDDFNRNLPD